MYKIRRERYRRGTGPSDMGPEYGSWRYDVYMGPYETENDCVEAIIRMEGEKARDGIEYWNGQRPWRYQGDMKPTGYIEYDGDEGNYDKYCKELMEHFTYKLGYARLPTKEEYLKYCIRALWPERYWDEYYIIGENEF